MKSKLSLELPVPVASLRITALAALAASLTACVTQVGFEAAAVGYDEPGYVEAQAGEAPPPLPDYEQPPCPEDGFVWTPGYWGWAGNDYYWVPGTWVQPPRVGVLWTPGYWAFTGGRYAFHAGYWGPHVGYYGGVNYGFGYSGRGFDGGAWHGNRYSYNRAVTNGRGNRASYNGGAGGIAAAPTGQDRQFWHENHVAITPMQQQHTQQAAHDPALFSRANGGHPGIAATPRPAAFNAPGAVSSRGIGPQFEGRPSQPQYQDRGAFPNQRPNQGQGPQTPQVQSQSQSPQGPQAARTEPQPQFQGRGFRPNQPPQGPQAPQVQQPQSHTPVPAQPLVHQPSPIQRPAQNHEPKHEREGEREQPHPKRRDDNDQSGH